ncbi:hypothetical protein D9619_006168 [Psilocybe cf. subviscida]|uniref:L-serine ammonia-lyase n=1 Tax=Psilocybe cf. subviscida TaxID=2480587 RepID=A0A8H5EXS5_9AGAR|nr:hypothetical protein D9619_006168 [Psilocybe cf. subviscida]
MRIGVGPSSSHTVGPMRAGKIFITDLNELGLLDKVRKGHHTPQAILLGLEGSDPETIDTHTIPARYGAILSTKTLMLGGGGLDPNFPEGHRITYDMDRDMLWRWDVVLKTHPNGMRFSAFDGEGTLLATNEYFSVGGGFVVNDKTKVDENLFYKGVDKHKVHGARLHQTHSLSDPSVVPISPSSDKTPSSLSTDTSTSRSSTGDAKASPPEGHATAQDEHPPYPFDTGDSLLKLTKKYNMTIAQIVHDNEKFFGYSDEDIYNKINKIWKVMDQCILTGVSTQEQILPGRLGLRRRAPMLYRRLMRGFYPGISSVREELAAIGGPGSGLNARAEAIPAPEDADAAASVDVYARLDNSSGPGNRYNASGLSSNNAAHPLRPSPAAARAPRVVGAFDHAVLPMPPRKTVIPAMDFLSCYAIAVNEVNASGGRIVTSPTNGAAGVIPAVLKYIIEFVSDDPDKTIQTFLLTASAVGMLFKRGSTISAAEGGCQAEVGVACSMAAAGFAACMGEHNLGLTCDPIDGLVQVPCIERNSLGAVKAVTAAQLSMASDGVYSVTLDEAIEAMRVTAADMSVKYKETSLSPPTSVKIPLTVPACFA